MNLRRAGFASLLLMKSIVVSLVKIEPRPIADACGPELWRVDA
jgi:hypothetical protein